MPAAPWGTNGGSRRRRKSFHFYPRLAHDAGFGFAHGHGFFAKHVLARAKRLNGLWGVEKDRRADVDGVNFRISESLIETFPGEDLVGRRFRAIAGHKTV